LKSMKCSEIIPNYIVALSARILFLICEMFGKISLGIELN